MLNVSRRVLTFVFLRRGVDSESGTKQGVDGDEMIAVSPVVVLPVDELLTVAGLETMD